MIARSQGAMETDLSCDEISRTKPITVIRCEESISTAHRCRDAIEDHAIIGRAGARVQLSQDDGG
jgi:hypothetical protein